MVEEEPSDLVLVRTLGSSDSDLFVKNPNRSVIFDKNWDLKTMRQVHFLYINLFIEDFIFSCSPKNTKKVH